MKAENVKSLLNICITTKKGLQAYVYPFFKVPLSSNLKIKTLCCNY